MYRILEKDGIAYGVYAGCIEALMVVILYLSRDVVIKVFPDNSAQIYNALVILLPLITLAIFIKKSAVQAQHHNSEITGFELFTAGYTTGLVASIVFASILWLAEFAMLLSIRQFSTFSTDLFNLVYNYAVVVGLGVTITIILSYFAYYLVTHYEQVTYPSSYRRLPEPDKKQP